MKHVFIWPCLAFALASVAAFAHSGATGVVKTRMDAMVRVGEAAKVLGQMDRSGDIDATRAREAAATLQEIAGHIPALFEKRDLSPPTEALPAVWDDRDGFLSRAQAMSRAAAALSAAGDDPEAFRQAFRGVAESCRACHADYRIKK